MELLHYTPNIHTFEIAVYQLNDKNLMPYERSESFRLLSTTNKIKKMIIQSTCLWKMTKLLINLCFQLQHLAINNFENS